jgi:5-methylcytosine-specific restriction endonuclease McrA
MKNNKHDILILNSSWVPIQICIWQKGMSHIASGKAKSLDKDFIAYKFVDWLEYSMLPEVIDDGYSMVNTINHKIAIPDIIVLDSYSGLPRSEVKFTRQSIFERDKFICQYCGQQFKREELEKEHVIPRSQGGLSVWTNIVTACGACNDKKAGMTPEQAGMKLIRKPVEPKWIGPFDKIRNKPNIRPAWSHFLDKVGV